MEKKENWIVKIFIRESKVKTIIQAWIAFLLSGYIMSYLWFDGIVIFKSLSNITIKGALFMIFVSISLMLFPIVLGAWAIMDIRNGEKNKNTDNPSVWIVILCTLILLILNGFATSTEDGTFFWWEGVVVSLVFSYIIQPIVIDFISEVKDFISELYREIKNWYIKDESELKRKDKNALLIGCGTLIFALISIFK